MSAHDPPRLIGDDRHDLAAGVLLREFLAAALRNADEQAAA
ncbi:MAG TPA: hypothetical protein VHN78_02030 [Chloroflexota bacterium]|nr:hypothetical protein [Chloroflexota bacterium]